MVYPQSVANWVSHYKAKVPPAPVSNYEALFVTDTKFVWDADAKRAENADFFL